MLVVCLGVLWPASAWCNTLYALSSSTPGSVYTIDTATGAATKVVDLTGNTDTSFVDVTFLGGTLYASDVFATGAFQFGTIDLTTGAFSIINNQGGSANWHSLAAVPSDGLIYAVDNDNARLVTVTPGA